MKDTLVYVSYYFPPYNTIASDRSIKFINILKERYSKIIILTLDDFFINTKKKGKNIDSYFDSIENIEVIKIKLSSFGYEDSSNANIFQKIISGILTRIVWSNGFFWQKKLVNKINEIINSENVNLIFVSGPPFLTFFSIYKVATRSSIPYILDYRDLWTMNPRSSAFKLTRNAIKKLIEKISINNASHVLTVSERCKLTLQKEFLIDNTKIDVQLNLPDLNYRNYFLKNYLPKENGNEKVKLVLTGSVYETCTFWPVLRALKQLADENLNKLEFHYFGATDKLVEEEFKNYNFSSLLINHGFVSKYESLKALEDADILISLVDDGKRIYDESIAGVMTTKVFDYFYSRKVILNIGPSEGDLNKFSHKIQYKSFYNFEAKQIDLITAFLNEFVCNPQKFKQLDYNIYQIPLFEEKFINIQNIFN